ncbi:hypothetical protein D3C86_1907790 [compost metagenome]
MEINVSTLSQLARLSDLLDTSLPSNSTMAIRTIGIKAKDFFKTEAMLEAIVK